MNAKFFLITMLALFSVSMNAQTTEKAKKMLVVYYSWSGNTREIATQIKDATGADIFEIVPEKAYSSDYDACVEEAKKEINENYKPALKTKIGNIQQYDMIFVGSPNWWNTIAPPVATFLSTYDLSGKTIAPFITHGGSRMGRSVDDIKTLCPKSTILTGLPISGSAVKSSNNDVLKWLRDIDVID